MPYDVGTAFLHIVPSFREIEKNLGAGVRQIAREIENTVGEALPNGVAQGAKEAQKQASIAGRRSGAAFGGSLGNELQTVMKAVQDKLPELNTRVRVESDPLDAAVDRIRQEVASIADQHLRLLINDEQAIKSLKGLRTQLRDIQVQARDSLDIAVNSKAGADILDTIDELERTGRQRGFEAGGAYSDAFSKRVVAAYRVLREQEITPDIDLDSPLRQVQDLRQRLQQLQHQKVGINFDAADAADTMRDLEASFRRIAETAADPQLRKDADRARAELAQFFIDVKTDTEKFADAQTAAAVKRGLNDLKAQAKMRLTGRKQAAAEQEAAQRESQALSAKALQWRIQAEAQAVAAQKKADEDLVASRSKLLSNSIRMDLQARAQASAEAAKEAQKAAKAAEDAFARTFAGRIPQMMRLAVQSFPERFDIDADTSGAQRRLFDLETRMRSLGEYEIGVDISTELAERELRDIRSGLQSLARSSPDIEIRTNARTALASIDAVSGGVRKTQKELIGLADHANFAQSRLTLMINAGFAIAPIIAPAAATAAAAIGFIGTAAGAAAAGIGVFTLGISGVGEAVKAMAAAQKDAANSAKSIAAARNQVINTAEAAKSAVQGVSNARAAADDAAISSATRVADAERNVIKTRREVGEAATASAQRVADAERAVVKARREAGEAAVASARRITDAERGVVEARREAREAAASAAATLRDAQRELTRAEGEALDVRQDLNTAIRDAKRDMEDLNLSVQQNALDQREATTSIMEEREKLNKILTNPRATEIEKRNARESFDARVLQLKQLQAEGRRMADEQAQYAKRGVEANDRVIAARDRIRAADERVAAQQRTVAEAQQRVAEVQMESVQRVASAERAVSDARRAQASQQIESAERIGAAERDVATARRAQISQQIASAERVAASERDVSEARRAQAAQQRQSAAAIASSQQALASAQRAQAQAVLAQATAGGEAMHKLKQAMDELSPAGQRFAEFIFNLKDEFLSMRHAAAEGMLPGLQQAITELLPYLPQVNGFIHEMGQALGTLFVNMVRSLANPTWQKFFSFFATNAIPTMQLLAEAGGNVATGFAELFLALTPFNADIGRGLLDLTEGFAKWARELTASTGYQEFLAYVRDVGPQVVNLLLQMGEFAGRLVVALAPAGKVLLTIFEGLFEVLNAINPTVLTVLASGLVLVGTAIVGLGLALKAVSAFKNLYGLLSNTAVTGMDRFRNATDRATTSVNKLGQTKPPSTFKVGLDGAAVAVGNFNRSVTGARTATQQLDGDVKRLSTSIDGGDPSGKKGMIGGVGRAVGVIGLLTVAGQGLGAAMASPTRNMHGFTNELAEFGRTGKASGELAREFGVDMTQLSSDLAQFNGGAANDTVRVVAGVAEGILGMVLPVDKFAGSLTGAQSRMGEIDAAMAHLVASGRGDEAAALFNRVAATAKEQGTGLTELNRLLPQYNNQLGVAADAAAKAADKVHTLTVETTAEGAATARTNAVQAALNANTNLSISARAQLGTTYDQNAAKINALSSLVDQFSLAEGTAAGRAKALKDVIDLQTGAAVRANEAQESFKTNMHSFTETVKGNAASIGKHANALDINTVAGRANRDALQNVASGIRDAYLADIESGVPMEEATKRHRDRITELLKEAGGNKKTRDETKRLVDQYGEVPQEVKTEFSTGSSFGKVYTELRRLNFMQKLVELGITDDKQAETMWKQSQNAANQAAFLNRATGGPISGPGTKTSDSILIRASHGEYMQQAAAVDYYGTGFMDAVNRRIIPKEMLPGFATGGFVQTRRVKQPRYTDQTPRTSQRRTAKAPYDVNVEDANIPTEAEARAVIEARMIPTGGQASGDINVARIAEATARKMKASNKQLLALIEAGLVESGMRNINYGDRDSVGFLQQRPSQGWGTVRQLMNVEYATRKFINAAKRKDRKKYTAGQLAQAVQISAFPDRYDEREADAYAVINREYPYIGGGGAGGIGGKAGGRGYPWQLSVLRKAFPGIDVYSTMRRGSRTLSGKLSWHAQGRAVDVEPTRKIARWIKENYGRNSLELITPWRDMMLYRGRPHRYSPNIERQHGVGNAGNDHIHWAYDQGGWLPPGMTSVINNTGKPEAVFTGEQFRDIRALVQGRGQNMGQQVYNFEFANTTLDAARLQAIQQRRDALERVGRSNY